MQAFREKLWDRYHLGYWGLAILLGFISFRLIFFMHPHNFADLVRLSHDPITGHPFWRAFQNRLLGAALLHLMWRGFHIPLEEAFKIFSLGVTIALNLLAFYVFWQLTGIRQEGTWYGFVFNFLFLALQDGKWILAWDYLDSIIFLLLAYSIFRRNSVRYFLILFLIAITNRETALYIPLWLMLSALPLPKSNLSRWNVRRMVAGAVLFILGSAYTWWIREHLFVRSSEPEIGLDMEHALLGNHFNLWINLRDLVKNFTHLQLDIIGTVFVVAIGYLVFSNRRKWDSLAIRVSLLMGVMLTAIFTIGLINETRHFLILIPFVLMLHLHFAAPRVS